MTQTQLLKRLDKLWYWICWQKQDQIIKKSFYVDIKESKRQVIPVGHPLVIVLNPGWLWFLGGNSGSPLQTQLSSLESRKGESPAVRWRGVQGCWLLPGMLPGSPEDHSFICSSMCPSCNLSPRNPSPSTFHLYILSFHFLQLLACTLFLGHSCPLTSELFSALQVRDCSDPG